ncbi:hypothetical protein [Amaricoccus solimangrovi]|uniref:GAF domain-containing protein n=1 Tax=Amaricoccus solimangrovi TaxID=2589815 RepID=A0A501WSU9_9RHOB|nr:hypothetical protein [Amaricoccus solimangrovi]TPE51922.1 hypothetical protein FJM51_07805 [Amaricoccus solimangrovi]
MSRLRRFGAAIREQPPGAAEIPPPGLADAQSQIGVPMLARSELVGAIFAAPGGSPSGGGAAEAFGLLAAQMGALLLALDREADEGARFPAPVFRPAGRSFA